MNKLVTKVDRLRTDIAMYDAQINAQSEEMKAANRNLTEAATELEVTTKSVSYTHLTLPTILLV